MNTPQVATILPIRYLQEIEGKPYHMALAHLVLQSDVYAAFYQQERLNGSYVIMDNGACEGEQLHVAALLAAAKRINPTEIALPDVLFEHETTLLKAETMLNSLQEYDLPYKRMAIPQGKDPVDWFMCAIKMINWPIDTIGIPKWLTRHGITTRSILLTALIPLLEQTNKRVHLLGCGDGLKELTYFLESPHLLPYIQGIDSALPYIHTQANSTLSVFSRRPNNPMIFHNAPDVSVKLLRDNIRAWERGFDNA